MPQNYRGSIGELIRRTQNHSCPSCLYVEPYEDYRQRIYFEDTVAIKDTSKALFCRIRLSAQQATHGWVAYSQICEISEIQRVGDRGALVLPRWLAVTMKLIAPSFGEYVYSPREFEARLRRECAL